MSDVERVGKTKEGDVLLKVPEDYVDSLSEALSLVDTIHQNSGYHSAESISPGTSYHEVLSIVDAADSPVTNGEIAQHSTQVSSASSTTKRLTSRGYLGRHKQKTDAKTRNPYVYYVNERGQEFLDEHGRMASLGVLSDGN